MCGISGIVGLKGHEVSENSLSVMTDLLAHRGPDGSGIFINQKRNVGFGHRRLSIIDLDKRSDQPLRSNHLIITYNGEIYNYIELRKELEFVGCVFNTSSDTEVLLKAYEAYGKACLNKLDGMFAFAIYDEREDEVFLARDRFGEKPLYYSIQGDHFYFASEIKSIASACQKLEVNEMSIYRYLAYDVVLNPEDGSETFYKDVFSLEPATYMQVKNGQINKEKYWDIDPSHQIKIDSNEAVSEFRSLFENSVQHRLRSDVAVGSSLSGGLDSSSVVAEIFGSNPKNFNCFTARFNDENFDEGKWVKILQEKYGFQWHEVYPESEEMVQQMPELFYHQEEPFGSSSIFAQWDVMKKAKSENVIVLLDGQGADEILGGYHKYFPFRMAEMLRSNPTIYKKLKNELKEHIQMDLSSKTLLQALFPMLFSSVQKNGRKSLNGLHDRMANKASAVSNPFGTFHNLNHMLYHDTFLYGLNKLLRFSDKNSMAHSREVRLPFLSHELVEFIFSLPSEHKINIPWSKYLLRQTMETKLPKELCWRKDKKGFGPPQNEWMKQTGFMELYETSVKELKEREVIVSEHAFNKWQLVMVNETFRFTERFS